MRTLWLAVPLACAVLAGGSLITDGTGIGASVAFAKNDGAGGGQGGGHGGGHGNAGGHGGGIGGGQGHAAGPGNSDFGRSMGGGRGNSDFGRSMDRGRGPSATGIENRSRAADFRDRTDRHGSRAASVSRSDRRDARSATSKSATTRSATSTTTRSASTTRSTSKSTHVKAANSLGNLNAAHASANARAHASPNSMVGRVATYETQMKSALAIQDPARREAAIIAAREQLALSANKPLTAEAITRVDGLLGIQGASPQLGAVR